MKQLFSSSQITSFRSSLVVALIGLALTPFWRGGRDGSGLLVIAVCLFFAWLFWSKHTREQRSIPRYILAPFSLIVVWQLLSIVWARDTLNAVLQSAVLVASVLMFAIVRQLAVMPQLRRQLLRYIVIGSLPVMAFGAYLYQTLSYDRAASFFYAPNAYALYLLLVWIIAVYTYRESRSRWRFALFLALASQFFLIQSLATLALALVVSVALFFRLNLTKKQVATFVIILAVGAGLAFAQIKAKELVAVDNVGTPDIAQELAQAKASGVTSRFSYWGSAVEIYTDNILLGVGTDNFQVAYSEYQKDPSLFTQNTHNIVLQTYAETGFIGGTLFILAMVAAGLFWWRRKDELEVTVYGLVLASIVLHASFYQTSRYPVFWLIFAAFLALLLTTGTRGVGKHSTPRRGSIFVIGALLIAIPAGLHYRSDAFADTGFDLYAERNIADSIEYLEKSTNMAIPPAGVYRSLALQYAFSSEFEQAILYADKAIEADGTGQSYLAKAFALQQSKAPGAEIRTAYELSLRLDPFNSVDGHLNYSRYLLDSGDTARAKEWLDFILPYYEDEDLVRIVAFNNLPERIGLLHFQRARLASLENDTALERASLERTIALYPDYQLAQRLLEQLNAR